MLFQRELCRIVCKIPNLNLKISPHNLKVSGSIPLPATNWISASHSTGFFCAVNPPVSEGFTNLPNSLNISLDSVASAKESLILCLTGDRKEYSSCWEKVIIRWHSPHYKRHPLKRFLALVGGAYSAISQPMTSPCNYSYGSIKTKYPSDFK